ncbi:MAG TPA: TrmH family RNA methyltransferase [Verrucomicrobiae bacterium]|nr:TrmH family RNA methyltransferase [Verrucomicrobiae bacterium]
MRQLVLIAHNLRSTHNVGSLLRTADGLGVQQVWLTGYTPYPLVLHDERLPHLAQKIDRHIIKTALGAEKTVSWQYKTDIKTVIKDLKHRGFTIAALEQVPNAISLPDFKPPEKLALVVGREVEGLEPEVVQMCDPSLEIPMFGSKESFNVVQAAAMALYHFRFS